MRSLSFCKHVRVIISTMHWGTLPRNSIVDVARMNGYQYSSKECDSTFELIGHIDQGACTL